MMKYDTNHLEGLVLEKNGYFSPNPGKRRTRL